MKINNLCKHYILIVCVILILMTSGCTRYEWREIDRVISDDKIVSLDLGQTIQGSFFLGCGNINGRTYYYYYKVEPDGAFTLQKAPTEFSRIYMDSQPETSHVIIMNGDSNPTECRSDRSDELCKREAYVYRKDYYFHVPAGTIVQSYDARLK